MSTPEGQLGGPEFELYRFFQADAADMVAARQKALLIHHSGDIDAAGDEVEQTVRKTVGLRLPLNYYVGHGHVVDKNLTTSSQFDIVIADNRDSPILFRAMSGTEYFPFESVYAVGEVKSTYYRARTYVEDFIEAIDRLRLVLSRDSTPPNYLGHGISVGSGFTTGVSKPYQNPLFAFLLAVDAGDFRVPDMEKLYSSMPIERLPNVLCLLNRGLLVNCSVPDNRQSGEPPRINITPEFNVERPGYANKWVLLEPRDDENALGMSLAGLFFMITSHLRTCRLMPPNMAEYLDRLFQFRGTIIAD
jgi:hypothetical protein